MYEESDMHCRLCLDQDSYEDETHTFTQCTVLLSGLKLDKNVVLNDIFGPLNLQIPFIKNLMKIINKRNILLELKDKSN